MVRPVENADEYAQAANGADPGIGNAGFQGCRDIGLNAEEGLHTHNAEDHKCYRGNNHDHGTVTGGKVGILLILLPQGFGQQGVHAHADAHGKADLQVLDGKGQG